MTFYTDDHSTYWLAMLLNRKNRKQGHQYISGGRKYMYEGNAFLVEITVLEWQLVL